jgi:ureidoacrylate peracid hydrolase
MFDRPDPARTAHLIVDLQNGFMEQGATVEIPEAREIVSNVNRISAAVRAAGGTNVFIRYLIDDSTITNWSSWFTDFATPARREAMEATFRKG